jgi:hypothetical protein
MKTVSYKEFATLYCESQRSTPQDLYATLEGQQRAYSPNGWMLLECVDLASSRLGSRCILPYGPRNTYKDLPSGPISPRGLASDMSNVIAVLRAEDLQYPAVS